ncbi:hypothetical protein VAPA_2c05180 [Variovorax paradoxus B4]|uniref:Uncharacterized protein n=1 Tax=Variovorax paradoxus B4 TaxID=1246301 RepID=T1XKI5_VARPD|nr:hypothetical protein VAPA_2c05180 [Variovorax paradoxus B4]
MRAVWQGARALSRGRSSSAAPVAYRFTCRRIDPLTELLTLALPPEAQRLPISPWRPVAWPTANVKPAASSVLVPPVGAAMSVRVAPFTKRVRSRLRRRALAPPRLGCLRRRGPCAHGSTAVAARPDRRIEPENRRRFGLKRHHIL